LTKLV